MQKLLRQADRSFRNGDWKEAARKYGKALKAEPENAIILHRLGAIAFARNDLPKALKLIRRSLAIKPDNPEALNNLGHIMHRMQETEQAAELYGLAVKTDPAFVTARLNHARALQELGDAGGASAEFERAIEYKPDSVRALCGLAGTRKIQPGDPVLGMFEQAAAYVRQMPFDQQIEFFFMWGKALDDVGEFSNAFTCLATGNRLRRQQRPYPRQRIEENVAAIKQLFTSSLSQDELEPSASRRPIFVVGMPRSGTTLTERVLGSHSAVLGAGELPVLTDAARAAAGVNTAQPLYPRLLEQGLACLQAVAEEYLAALRLVDDLAPRVVDKMPGNFWNIGLIRLLFPNARIVHVKRNAVDTLLSCFQQNFTVGQSFSNGFDSAAHHYAMYERVMAHWAEWEPGCFYTIRYEELVENVESTARGMIEYLGLEWDPACAAPHKAGGTVRTASIWQARQPVYRTSMARWRRYETELQPLLEKLDEYGVEWRE